MSDGTSPAILLAASDLILRLHESGTWIYAYVSFDSVLLSRVKVDIYCQT